MSKEEKVTKEPSDQAEEKLPWFRQRSDSLGDIQTLNKSRKTDSTFKRKDRDEQSDTGLLIEMMKSMECNIQENVRRGRDELKSMLEENNKGLKKVIDEIKGEITQIKERQDRWEEDKNLLLGGLKQQEKEQEMQKEKIESLENRLCHLETNIKKREELQECLLEKKEIKRQEDRLRQLEMNLERKEKNQRKDNIIIKGKKFDKQNTTEDVRKFLKEKLDVEAQISETKTIKVGEAEHTIVKLGSFQQKTEILKSKSKLKQETEKIFIENDLTFQERKIQREIINFARKHTGKEVKISYQKLKVDSKLYKWDHKTGSVIESQNEPKN